MILKITGSGLTIEDVVNVARNNQKVELDPAAVERIHACRAMLEKKIEALLAHQKELEKQLKAAQQREASSIAANLRRR